MDMKICIDIRTLIDKQYSGVGMYTLKLLSNLFEIDKKNEYKLFYNSAQNRFVKKYYPNVTYYDYKMSNKLFNSSTLLFKYPKIDKLVGDFDIFFAPNINFFAFSKKNKSKKVITIHDISFKLFPEFYSKKGRLWHKLTNPKKLLKNFDHIITVSNNTKNDLIKYYNVDQNKVSAIHLGIDEPVIDKYYRKRIIEGDYLLYIGTIEPRKNIEGIIKSFEDFCDENKNCSLKLVLAGKNGWNNKYIYRIINHSNFKDKIIIKNYVSEEDKKTLFRDAKIFLFPSFYEGFGLPVIEAQSYGLPVITSANSSMLEISNNSTICVNPYNTNEIKEAIKNLYFDKSLYAYYKNKGLENYKNFTWEKTARETLKLFQELAK